MPNTKALTCLIVGRPASQRGIHRGVPIKTDSVQFFWIFFVDMVAPGQGTNGSPWTGACSHDTAMVQTGCTLHPNKSTDHSKCCAAVYTGLTHKQACNNGASLPKPKEPLQTSAVCRVFNHACCTCTLRQRVTKQRVSTVPSTAEHTLAQHHSHCTHAHTLSQCTAPTACTTTHYTQLCRTCEAAHTPTMHAHHHCAKSHLTSLAS